MCLCKKIKKLDFTIHKCVCACARAYSHVCVVCVRVRVCVLGLSP